MPVLNWIGKESIVNHDKDVPFRLLKKIKGLSVGESENLIIEGDNLEGLKALLPYYQNKIKCIYIDPPYNTGNENWVYNDNVNAPKIKQWLGKVVGIDDLTKHDKWLCMMYPRLKLLYNLLSDEGVLFASIDDNEVHNLRALLSEIFLEENFIAILPTVMNLKGNQDQFGFAGTHEYTLVFSKNKSKCKIKHFRITDDDELEKWEEDRMGYFKKGANLKSTGTNAPRNKRPNLYYPLLFNPKTSGIETIQESEYKKIYNEDSKSFDDKFVDELKKKYEKLGYVFILPITDGKEMTWRWEIYKIKNESYNIIVNSNVEDITIYKKQRPGIGDLPSKKPKSLFYKPEYSSGNGTGQIKDIFGQKIFDNPKPLELIKDIIEISTEKDDIILDSFAGTGTTGHAVMKLNKEDDGKRNFILIELEDKVAKRITRERLKKVIKTENYRNGFEFCELDKPLFDKDGKIDQDCSFEDLASYIYFTETKTILDKNKIAKNFIGEHSETKYYLIFRGIGKNTLTTSFLKGLNKESRKIIYADNCTISEDELEQRNIIFKQIPYEVRVF